MENQANIDNLQLEYARAGSLYLYKKVVAQGAQQWYNSALVAAASPLGSEICAYLFHFFGQAKRSLILAAYAARRYESLLQTEAFSLETYLESYYKEPDAQAVFESIALGAVMGQNIPLLEKCLTEYGVSNLKDLARVAIASGAQEIFVRFRSALSKEEIALWAAQTNNYPVLQSIGVEKLSKEERASLAQTARAHGHEQLSQLLSL